MRFLKIGDASKELGVSISTIRRWVDNDQIPHRTTPGGHRLVDVEAYLEGKSKLSDPSPSIDKRKSIFYCRVSSKKQSDDLDMQKSLAKQKYPEHEIISDIGSGINWKRKGFQSVLDRVMRGEVKEIVVFHRDRLCRIGYELIEFICSKNGTKLMVHDRSDEEHRSSEQELADDLMAIVSVFTCKAMGNRRYTLNDISIEKHEDLPDQGTEKDSEGMDE